MNIVVLCGHVVDEPSERALADGSSRWSFDLATSVERSDGPPERVVVPVVVSAAAELSSCVRAGRELVVVGRVRRRFFRSGGVTVSRTEVAALELVEVTRRRPLAAALARAAAALGGGERTTLRSCATG